MNERWQTFTLFIYFSSQSIITQLERCSLSNKVTLPVNLVDLIMGSPLIQQIFHWIRLTVKHKYVKKHKSYELLSMNNNLSRKTTKYWPSYDWKQMQTSRRLHCREKVYSFNSSPTTWESGESFLMANKVEFYMKHCLGVTENNRNSVSGHNARCAGTNETGKMRAG